MYVQNEVPNLQGSLAAIQPMSYWFQFPLSSLQKMNNCPLIPSTSWSVLVINAMRGGVSGRWGVPVTMAEKEVTWLGKSHVYWKNLATPTALWVPGRGSQQGRAEEWRRLVTDPFSPVFPASAR